MSRARWALVALGALGAAALYLFWNPGAEVYLVPEGYVGPVVVAFNHPRGVKRERTLRSYVYRIPRDGVLRIRDSMPDGAKVVAWFYADAQGRRARIPDYWPGSDRHALTTPHVCCQQTGSRGPAEYTQASIGVPADDNGFYPAAHFTTDAVIDEYGK